MRAEPDRWLTDRRAVDPRWGAGLEDWVTALAVSPDGALVAAGSAAGETVVLDAATGAVVATPARHALGVAALAWSADGAVLASGGQDGAVRLWPRRNGGQPVAAALAGPAGVAALSWSVDGLLAVGVGRRVLICDAAGTVVAVHDDAPSTVTALAWSSDGRRLAAAAYGGVQWYGVGADGVVAHRRYPWKGSVLAIAIGPGDRWMVGGAQDSTIHVWRLWSGTDYEMAGFPGKVEHLSWHHRGRWLMAGCVGMLTRWDFSGKGPSGRKAEVFDTNGTRVVALTHEPSGDRVATLLADGGDAALVLWRPGRSTRPDHGYPLGGPAGALAWLPSGDAVVVGTGHGRVFLHALP